MYTAQQHTSYRWKSIGTAIVTSIFPETGRLRRILSPLPVDNLSRNLSKYLKYKSFSLHTRYSRLSTQTTEKTQYLVLTFFTYRYTLGILYLMLNMTYRTSSTIFWAILNARLLCSSEFIYTSQVSTTSSCFHTES